MAAEIARALVAIILGFITVFLILCGMSDL